MQGRRKTTKSAPAVTQNIIQGNAPDWMHPYARETWIQTLADLDREGRKLAALDIESFSAFCVAAGTVRLCSETLDREGLTIDGGRDGKRKHPASSTLNSAQSQVRQFAAELGLSSASRGRLAVQALKPKLTKWQLFDAEFNKP